MSRYTYPTAFGINIDTNSSRLTYEELFRRKWAAMGARPNTIRFADAGGGPGSKFKRIFNAQKPEAHAVVLGTDKDVWIAFRGLTSVDSALASDMRHSPTEALFGSKKVTVHSGFYNGFRALWPQVMVYVRSAIMQTEDPRQAKIYITGHSLGGAHALFTALKLSEMKLKNIGGVYLFGTPKIGQTAFLELFQESGLEPITSHWWNELDMVPNLGTAGPWKRSHYESLPQGTLYRIWDGKCGRANEQTAQACPLGPRKCRKNVNDHRAFSYVAKLQACVLQQTSIAHDKCLNSKVMTSM
jgi:pimeloyl-ACP methyl ester carboxylesterase